MTPPFCTRSLVRVLVGFVVLVGLAAGCGSGADAARFEVDHAWARATPPGASRAAAYLVLTVPREDRLVGASVPVDVAAAVEIHVSSTARGRSGAHGHGGAGTDDATVQMQRVDAVPLARGEPTEFEPGGRHLMLVGLAAQLRAGTTFPLTLHFAHGKDRTVQVAVRDNP